jgi:TPP-dependent pyruvate/acetoin dehydrogenase alpha subunit
MMAELFGKATGYCKGKGGSMHIAAVDKGILGANGIVGGGLPIAVGAGLSSKLRKTGKVVACFFGDGAANTGSFHESLNLAAIFRLPILFVCENNCYAVSTPIKASISIESISERALAYGIRGISVDGNNVIEIYQVAKEAIEHIRSGEGPVLLEAKTYRIEGHYYGDVGKYRSKEEVDVWRRKDPIQNLATQLLEEGVCSEDDLSAFDKMANQKIDEAVDYAKNSPDPIPEDALADVY